MTSQGRRLPTVSLNACGCRLSVWTIPVGAEGCFPSASYCPRTLAFVTAASLPRDRLSPSVHRGLCTHAVPGGAGAAVAPWLTLRQRLRHTLECLPSDVSIRLVDDSWSIDDETLRRMPPSQRHHVFGGSQEACDLAEPLPPRLDAAAKAIEALRAAPPAILLQSDSRVVSFPTGPDDEIEVGTHPLSAPHWVT